MNKAGVTSNPWSIFWCFSVGSGKTSANAPTVVFPGNYEQTEGFVAVNFNYLLEFYKYIALDYNKNKLFFYITTK